MIRRKPKTGSVDTDNTNIQLSGCAVSKPALQARGRVAMEVEHGCAGRIALLGEAKEAAIGECDGLAIWLCT